VTTSDTLAEFALPEGMSTSTCLAGRYELLSRIGSGGMGTVYKALDRRLDVTVALKLLRPDLASDPKAIGRLWSEAKLARKVTHRNVVRTFDLGEERGHRFITMEYVEGQSLGQLVAGGAVLPIAEAIRIGREVAAGLASAHDAGVLHRDLKPDNILIADDGRVLITDFGVAGAAGAAGRTGGIRGTPAYMAPEQVSGQTLDGRCDVYALGAVMYELLAGSRAWSGDDTFAVALRRLREPPPDLGAARPDLPRELVNLVTAMLALAPEQRPVDGKEVAARLAVVALPSANSSSSWSADDLPRSGAKSVAVLPFRAPADRDYLGDGLAEEVIDLLSMTAGLRVRPLGSVGSDQRDPVEAGRTLGVDVVVTGSVQLRGDRVRVRARLIDVEGGFQMWAGRFDVSAADALSAADEVAEALGKRLTVSLAPMPRRVHVDPEVVDLYLRGRHAMRAGWHTVMGPAIALLGQAASRAPDDPHILAALAQAHGRRAYFGGETIDDLIAVAQASAKRAIDVGPEHGEAWLALASAYFIDMKLPESAEACRRALALSPGLAEGQLMLGSLLMEAGRLDEASARLRAALKVDPGHTAARLMRVQLAALQGDWDAVRERVRPLIDEGRSIGPAIFLARHGLWSDQAPELPDNVGSFISTDERSLEDGLKIVEFYRELRGGTAPSMDRVRDIGHRMSSRGSPIARVRALVIEVEMRAFSGDVEGAIPVLRAAVDLGLADQVWMRDCPVLEPLREDVRWSDLYRRVQAVAEQIVTG